MREVGSTSHTTADQVWGTAHFFDDPDGYDGTGTDEIADAALTAAVDELSLAGMRAALEGGADPQPQIERLLAHDRRDDAADELQVAGLRLLEAYGAAPLPGRDANEILHLTAVCGRGPLVTQWVLDAGADASFCDSSKTFYSALHNVIRPDVARLLLAAGAQLDAVDCHGWTPLPTVGPVLEVLLEAGANVSRCCNTHHDVPLASFKCAPPAARSIAVS